MGGCRLRLTLRAIDRPSMNCRTPHTQAATTSRHAGRRRVANLRRACTCKAWLLYTRTALEPTARKCCGWTVGWPWGGSPERRSFLMSCRRAQGSDVGEKWCPMFARNKQHRTDSMGSLLGRGNRRSGHEGGKPLAMNPLPMHPRDLVLGYTKHASPNSSSP